MNADALARLGQNAAAFGRAYTALVESLMREGVPEPIARQEARATAAMAAIFGATPNGDEECPLCGRSGPL